MGIAGGWIEASNSIKIYAKTTVCIFSVSPQSRSLFSASLQTFCLIALAYLNMQKYRLFCSLIHQTEAKLKLFSKILLILCCKTHLLIWLTVFKLEKLENLPKCACGIL